MKCAGTSLASAIRRGVGNNRGVWWPKVEWHPGELYPRVGFYLAELCVATGASDRTLRACCKAHLGMGPTRYLWLRRMHLARHALRMADPTATTAISVGTDYGFRELGRFSVAYRSPFGESPSATLRHPPYEPLPQKMLLRPGSCRKLHRQPPSDGPTLAFVRLIRLLKAARVRQCRGWSR
jgi:AraC-like DNA-binding protein